jgi:hypothetical protein
MHYMKKVVVNNVKHVNNAENYLWNTVIMISILLISEIRLT